MKFVTDLSDNDCSKALTANKHCHFNKQFRWICAVFTRIRHKFIWIVTIKSFASSVYIIIGLYLAFHIFFSLQPSWGCTFFRLRLDFTSCILWSILLSFVVICFLLYIGNFYYIMYMHYMFFIFFNANACRFTK